MEDPTLYQIITDYDNGKGISFEESSIDLSTNGFIKPISIISEPPQAFAAQNKTYELTDFGREVLMKHSNFIKYFKAQAGEDAKQLANEERDEKTKNAILKKLEAELLVLKDMQAEQRTFWQSGIDRDNRQRWQFCLTLTLAIGGFILGIINFVKSIVLPK